MDLGPSADFPQDLFHALLSQQMVYRCDADDRIVDMNPAGLQLLGYQSANDVIGTPMANLYASPEDRGYLHSLLRDQGAVRDLEVVLRQRNGTLVFVLETAVASPRAAVGDANRSYWGVMKDISDRVEAQRKQLHTNLELAETNRLLKATQSRLVQQEKLASVGQLAAGLAHEINNPLSFIISNLDSLRSYVTALNLGLSAVEKLIPADAMPDHRQIREEHHLDEIAADLEDLFRESRHGLDHIASVVHSLKTFSRSGIGQNQTMVDLNEALESTLVIARNELKQGITLVRNLSPLPLVSCRADEINQVILNLLLNAVHAIRVRQSDIPGTITVRTLAQPDCVVLEVEDNGPGIAPHDLRRVFEPFFTTKPVGEGTGLGLSISYDIVVNRHGGDLSVTSEPGRGARFTVKLPCSERDVG